MRCNDENHFVESWTSVVRYGEDGSRWTERRPSSYKAQWRNYSYTSKYAETPANVSSSMRRYAKKAVEYLETRMKERAHEDAKEESEESK